MLSCEELVRRVAEGEPLERSLWLRLKVRLHLWICAHCRRYAEQIQAIGEAARSLARAQAADGEQWARQLEESVLQSLLGDAPARRG